MRGTLETRPGPRVGLVTVGDEILSGRITDRHSEYLSSELEPLGYRMVFHLSVGDREGDLCRVLRGLPAEVDALFITGGLGPTEDDRTRSEVAGALGVELEFRESAWERIERHFQRRGIRAAASNRRQAFFPAGTAEIANPYGTAPGFRAQPARGTFWWALPGVPWEFRQLLEQVVIPELRRELPPPPLTEPGEVLRFFAIAESRLDEWILARLDSRHPSDYHIRVASGELEVHLPPGVRLSPEARDAFGVRYLGTGCESLAFRLIAAATEKKRTFVTAESSTGGLLGSRVTAVPGASAVYLGGWVVYSNPWKRDQLGVPNTLIDTHGAVSREVAVAMARGARTRGGADLAVAITGIAGPGGGSVDKPVGTTHVALADAEGTRWRHFQLRGDRDTIRELASQQALFALWARVHDTEPFGWEHPAAATKKS